MWVETSLTQLDNLHCDSLSAISDVARHSTFEQVFLVPLINFIQLSSFVTCSVECQHWSELVLG